MVKVASGGSRDAPCLLFWCNNRSRRGTSSRALGRTEAQGPVRLFQPVGFREGSCLSGAGAGPGTGGQRRPDARSCQGAGEWIEQISRRYSPRFRAAIGSPTSTANVAVRCPSTASMWQRPCSKPLAGSSLSAMAAEQEAAAPPPDLGYEVMNWLENVGNAVRGDDYPAELNQRLLYRLHPFKEGVKTPPLAVSLLSVRVLKGGDFGGNYAQPSASDFAPERAPKYYRDTDIDILSQLSASSRGAYYGTRPASGELLQRIVATGRAYWLDHKRQPLRWGNNREGRIEWRQVSKRGVVPCLLVPGTIALNAEPPVYVDEFRGNDRTGGTELAAEACPPVPVGAGDSGRPGHGSIASSWPTSAGTSSRPAAGNASARSADRRAAGADIALCGWAG